MQETLVYPGHPLHIALLIMETFPDIAAAQSRDDDEFPAALMSEHVKGSAPAVCATLDILERAKKERLSPEEIVEIAQTTWEKSRIEGDNASALQEGLKQGDRLAPIFCERYSKWAALVPA